MHVRFLFNSEIYRKIDGVAMCSPLDLLLADNFMSKLENNPLKQHISYFDVFLRYIADSFVVCNNTNDIDDLLGSFNEVQNAI